MPFFAKESLETLKQRIDLIEVVSSYVELKRTGAAYKGLCPFHDEKTPSFAIQKGQSHYHCFGCGAHGDAIAFLINYAKLSFVDAVEALAQRYHVILERVEGHDEEKTDRRALKNALEAVCRFYHALLLHTEEGHAACRYLAARGIDEAFIRRFRLGYAYPHAELLLEAMQKQRISRELLIEAGVLTVTARGSYREMFSDRITFPICDASGSVIGFSARKFKEDTYGGKYVNTPETPLFKKSRVLFGLDISRRRIAKERRAVIVEGQVDALRLLFYGLDLVVATQGTAFGEGHLKELTALGVQEIFLAFDADAAGREAAVKVGHLCHRQGIGAKVVHLPEGMDPDSFVRQYGIQAFIAKLEGSEDYLPFLVEHCSREYDLDKPAGKNALVQYLVPQIRTWGEQVMVHECLRQLANLLKLPEEMVGATGSLPAPLLLKRSAYAGAMEIDPDRILESEMVRWVIDAGEQQANFLALAMKNIPPNLLQVTVCRRAYEACLFLHTQGQACDLLSLAIALGDGEGQAFLTEIMLRKVNQERAEELFTATLKKILDREWMRQREALRIQIQSGSLSDAEVDQLIVQFDDLRRQQPKVRLRDQHDIPSLQ